MTEQRTNIRKGIDGANRDAICSSDIARFDRKKKIIVFNKDCVSFPTSGVAQTADANADVTQIRARFIRKKVRAPARDRTRFPRAGPVIGVRYDGSARGVPVSQVTSRRTVVPPGHT